MAVENCMYTHMIIDGASGTIKDNAGSSIEAKITVGDFGAADPEVVKATGMENYNIEIKMMWGQGLKELGIVSEDGMQITTKGHMGVAKLSWATNEEIEAMLNDGDPIEAPPSPYTLQPNKVGKLLWITGPPGLGKSTTAQLLSRHHGYVYYEADCFANCRNPYIPPNVENPSMAQVSQRPLKGEGLAERKKICAKLFEFFKDIIEGKEGDKENMKPFYEEVCNDILRERKRIGGDWAIAAVVMTRELRDFIRERLGPDLVFVVLSMDAEDMKKRVRERHHGDESAVEMMAPFHRIFEPVDKDEKKVLDILVNSNMTREDLVQKVLESV